MGTIIFRPSGIIRLGIMATLLGIPAIKAVGDDEGDAVASANGLFRVWGCKEGILAYSTDGGVCNIGDAALPGEFTTTHHVMWTQNLYRLSEVDGVSRFEQIGLSWLKHDDWTTTNNPCSGGGCTETTCNAVSDMLGAGCRDTYSCQNGNNAHRIAAFGPRSQVNPLTGIWAPTGDRCNIRDVASCRLQVPKAVLDEDGDPENPYKYFLEQQVITPDEPLSSRTNNASYIEEDMGSCATSLCAQDECGEDRICSEDGSCGDAEDPCVYSFTKVGSTYICQDPAIRAWKEIEDSVIETDVDVTGDGRFILSAKATQLSGTLYHYEYALYNMNSERAARSFSIPLGAGTVIDGESIGFHGVAHHSGDGYTCDDCTCLGGSRNGQSCNLPTDCRVCVDGSNPGTPCQDNAVCLGGGTCPIAGVCKGGTNDGSTCDDGGDCASPGYCRPGGLCMQHCDGGSNDEDPCSVDEDCPGGVCTGRLNYEDSPWLPATVDSESITWSTDDYGTNPNANALRWGTLYNFRFQTCSPPITVVATIGHFKGGGPSSKQAVTIGPAPPGACCTQSGCTVLAEDCCSDQGGTFKGTGTHCEDCNLNEVADACELPIRACCLPPEEASQCVMTTEVCCENEGGNYLGEQTTCESCPCCIIMSGPQPEP